MEQLPIEANLVDLGCGNGELAAQLIRRGQCGVYLGVDFSSDLLAKAEEVVQSEAENKLHILFRQLNLTEVDRLNDIAAKAQPVSALLSFATLHHIPGINQRLKILKEIARILSESREPEPLFIHSEWQFLNSERLTARIVPWEVIGLTKDQLETGDYLLDWRRGGTGLRYVHHFNQDELVSLADQAGFDVLESFLSDGENSKLGLYQVWRLKR